MWNESPSSMFLAVIAGSILVHVALLAVLPPREAAAHDKPAPPVFVSIEAPKPAPPPPPPAPEPVPVAAETVAARPVARAPRPVARRVATRETVAPTPTAAAPAEPADFSGLTLTNEGAGWSTPVGDGSPMTGPIAAPQEVAVKAPVRASGGGTGDRVVAVGDLSRPPKAPNLDAQLAANYPADARAAGRGGSAVIRVRILVDGRVGTTRVVSESAPGFGKACQRTLAGSRWQPPLDANHQAVATDLSYTCTFAVAR